MRIMFKIKQTKLSNDKLSGFTIIELLVVITIIAILAAISILSYIGLSNRANEAVLQAELANAKKQLAIYNIDHGFYPTSLDAKYCPNKPTSDTNYCLKFNSGSTITYYGNSMAYNLILTKNNVSYGVSADYAPMNITQPSSCPTGYIPVPGSGTYGTKGFCVMKYEAKDDGSGNAVSTAAGFPWVNINQIDSTAKSAAACTGCHLMTEKEWMTLMQNVFSVTSNWSSGVISGGYFYNGNSYNNPSSALAADTNDTNGYAGETNVSGRERRTLTLTNGQVIWDMVGNVWEWTTGQTMGGQPGLSTDTSFTFRGWSDIDTVGNLAQNPSPATAGLMDVTECDSDGIGQIYSYSKDTPLRGFIRGGNWGGGSCSGPSSLYLARTPGRTDSYTGFRVAR